jgi:hypothetical protein
MLYRVFARLGVRQGWWLMRVEGLLRVCVTTVCCEGPLGAVSVHVPEAAAAGQPRLTLHSPGLAPSHSPVYTLSLAVLQAVGQAQTLAVTGHMSYESREAARPFSSSVRTNPIIGGAFDSSLRHWARPPSIPSRVGDGGRAAVSGDVARDAMDHHAVARPGEQRSKESGVSSQGSATCWRVQRRVLRALVRTDRDRHAAAAGLPPPGTQQLLKRWVSLSRPHDNEDSDGEDGTAVPCWQERSRQTQLTVRQDRAR